MRNDAYFQRHMDGFLTFKAAVAAIALATLGGSIAPALAETAIEASAAQTSAAPASDLPRFEPSFESAFAEVDQPVIDTLEAGAVDLAGIEPAAEPPARELGAGVASWYGRQFAGRKTANGERFDPGQYTAAHRTLPFGSRVRVSRGGKSVIVRINDRGPFHGNRVIDLSQAAAAELGLINDGSGQVQLALING